MKISNCTKYNLPAAKTNKAVSQNQNQSLSFNGEIKDIFVKSMMDTIYSKPLDKCADLMLFNSSYMGKSKIGAALSGVNEVVRNTAGVAGAGIIGCVVFPVQLVKNIVKK